MAETNFSPNLGEVFEIPPEADDGSGSGGSGGTTQVYIDNYGGGVPTPTPAGDAVAIDSSSDAVWYYEGGVWTQVPVGGSGTTIQYSAASDPSGVPVGNARVWLRMDTGNMWVYNTGTAAWEPYL